ncbi:putative linoleate 9S-lipoxygenase 5 [Capsicum annuum]|nr:putative linoleate 9S-lipoxygenase 5 [Capsicum annuum]
MVLDKIVDAITGKDDGKKVKGRVVLMKKNVLDFTDVTASVLDGVLEFLGQRVSFELISTSLHDENGLEGKRSKPAYLEHWLTNITPIAAGESAFSVTFDWDHEELGVPGAFIIKNLHFSEFFLKSLTLEDVPNHGKIHFVCDSWVYPASKYKSDRIFFANQAYLPSETPEALRKYRENELVTLRGDGTGKLEEWDRVYDYAYYNDLGDPDNGEEYARPVLGGSSEYPYPRRGRTGREPTKTDPNTESRIPLLMSLDIYVPRDERFGHVKLSDFLTFALKSIVQLLLPEFKALFDSTPNEFDSFADVLKLYEGGIKLPQGPLLKAITDGIPLEILRELLQTDGEGLFKYPTPQVIQEDKTAWRTDDEFGREMLAGLNPVIISKLQEFPPKSKLDPKTYGNQSSTITREQIEDKLDGLTVDEAIKTNRLFILNHHDTLMPYLRRINTTTNTKTYASRTLLFLQDNGTLKPLAIELSLPHPDGDQLGTVSKVFTPSEQGVEGSIWQLAKAYAAVNDSGVHQLISHWLNTHAVIEPFVIATNRQLSVLHPIHKLLLPHFRDTMNINALARQILINGGGVLELTVFPAKYSMEMSAVVYKDWIFPEQALPVDLIKRGVAVEDSSSKHGIRLLIQDYPYAADGLEIWSAIKSWVTEYCNFYYKSDDAVQKDAELQAWWKELREEGHGDKKDEPWWPKMQTRQELIDSCTITIWIASALHAAVNFGQYPYAGYLPNRPTLSRNFMPEPGSAEYEELKTNPDKVFLKTITPQLQTLLGISLIEILSRHASDTLYLGQRDSPEWTKDQEPLSAFERFGQKLSDIEAQILQMNGDHEKWKNRSGPVKVPYTLLFPTSEEGLTGKGIPNRTVTSSLLLPASQAKSFKSSGGFALRPSHSCYLLIVDAIIRKDDGKKVKGTVILMKKNVLDFTNINASVLDGVREFLGQKASFQLISTSVHAYPPNGLEGKRSNPAYLENWITNTTPIIAGETTFSITFDWDDDEFGVPGAFIIKNLHINEFFLKSLTLEDVPNHGKIHFICNSWVYPASKYKSDRIFFANQAYLPSETPESLRKYREDELVTLRGDGTGKLEEWDRVYDYAYYNDLGDPDKGNEYARPVLGGSSEYPYPRRGRTGRDPTKTDPNSESRIPLFMSLDIYVPRDERFGHMKMSDFLTFSLKSIMQILLCGFKALFDKTPNEFDSFEDVLKLYEGGFKLPRGPLLKAITDSIPLEILKPNLQTDDEDLLKYPIPQVIHEDKSAWRTDEEFGREMLAGVNPVIISRLQEFPPKSKLDPNIYGNQNSTITRDQIEDELDGLTIDESIKTNKLFVLNHHDIIMPFLRRINTAANTKTYASRTLLFLQDNGTLKPLAIELSLPHPDGDQFGTVSKVYTPFEHGVEGSIWQLAKAYVAVNDTGIHALISHW